MQGGRSRVKKLRSRLGLSRSMILCSIFAVVYFLFDWWLLSSSQFSPTRESLPHKESWDSRARSSLPVMYERLLALAAHALAEAEEKTEPEDLWSEPVLEASAWRPCADVREANHKLPLSPGNNTGYILIDANGGLNQQRVAICNAIAVARLLNATLVLPHFMLSNVWQDESQFGDIYDENYFIDYLKEDVHIVKQLPLELQSLDLQAIGSFFSDADVIKEAKPSFYLQHVLPVLLRNRVVCFSGFGNRLSFDPIPFDIQRLRCRCNFHALRFSPKIREIGNLLVQRIHQRSSGYSQHLSSKNSHSDTGRYLALHLRFEIDMVAYSLCEFGGGEKERLELQTYRNEHFPLLVKYQNQTRHISPRVLRELGQCPLTPEEAALMLAALGFKRDTHIFLAGAHIYGGQSRLIPVSSLYPNLVTKEDLLTKAELAPFANHSSQLAALDFIACISADVFAMTDSGSQLASLVSGYRMYYGGGKLPVIRPNKKRLASIYRNNLTIHWLEFEEKVRKAVRETKKVQARPIARSVYRHPRSNECMCKS